MHTPEKIMVNQDNEYLRVRDLLSDEPHLSEDSGYISSNISGFLSNSSE